MSQLEVNIAGIWWVDAVVFYHAQDGPTAKSHLVLATNSAEADKPYCKRRPQFYQL